MNRHLADDRGSIPVETVILVPAIAMFLLVLILAGRIALARTAVESAAADAARSARSLAHPAKRVVLLLGPPRAVWSTSRCHAAAPAWLWTPADSTFRSAPQPACR